MRDEKGFIVISFVATMAYDIPKPFKNSYEISRNVYLDKSEKLIIKE